MRGRGAASSRTRGLGQHFLADRNLARKVVENAGVSSADLVVDLGAGTGVLTGELATRAGRIVAVEADPALYRRLEARFAAWDNVALVLGDALRVALPREPFRVVANIPFGCTTAILRRLLDDPASRLLRMDVVVQWGAAVKRARVRPSTQLGLSWAPWWEFTITRHIPRTAFRPVPSVDAGALAVTRRPDPLLHPEERPAYVALLSQGFTRSSAPLRRALAGVAPPKRLKRIATQLGFDIDARPMDLDVGQWTQLYEWLS